MAYGRGHAAAARRPSRIGQSTHPHAAAPSDQGGYPCRLHRPGACALVLHIN